MNKAIIHFHSSYSYDSFNDIRRIIDKCVSNNIKLMILTDHDTLKGYFVAKDYIEKRYKNIIRLEPAVEYTTEMGDIIVLGIESILAYKDFRQLIISAKENKGIILLPHPYDGHKSLDELVSSCDFIESFNARSLEKSNIEAKKISIKFNKPAYAASDAHFESELFNAVNYINSDVDIFNDDIFYVLKSIYRMETQYSKKYNIFLSQSIKGLKTLNIMLLSKSLLMTIKLLIIQK